MKKALIHGARVCQVVAAADVFPVAPGLTWVDCPDDTVAGVHVWNGERFNELPAPTARDLALAEIARLEGQVTARRMRDAILTQAGADWLAAQEQLIATERAKL